MSHQQPRRPQTEPIKYGDVFPVSGDLAREPIGPQDAAMMQTAENLVLGQTQKGGTAAVMQSVATRNESAGLVGHNQVSHLAGEEGVTVSEADFPGRRIITESVAGQIIGQYAEPTPVEMKNPAGSLDYNAITIGEALEASALSAGDKPVDQSDAAAIQAAEVRATGRNVITPGGVASAAQSAANRNAQIMRDADKTTLADVLTDATLKLPADKAATRQDAEGIVSAELRNNPILATHPAGVAASVTAAARLNHSSA